MDAARARRENNNTLRPGPPHTPRYALPDRRRFLGFWRWRRYDTLLRPRTEGNSRPEASPPSQKWCKRPRFRGERGGGGKGPGITSARSRREVGPLICEENQIHMLGSRKASRVSGRRRRTERVRTTCHGQAARKIELCLLLLSQGRGGGGVLVREEDSFACEKGVQRRRAQPLPSELLVAGEPATKTEVLLRRQAT